MKALDLAGQKLKTGVTHSVISHQIPISYLSNLTGLSQVSPGDNSSHMVLGVQPTTGVFMEYFTQSLYIFFWSTFVLADARKET